MFFCLAPAPRASREPIQLRVCSPVVARHELLDNKRLVQVYGPPDYFAAVFVDYEEKPTSLILLSPIVNTQP
jgi:hypothetical protein